MGTVGGIGEIPDGEITGELGGREGGGYGWHGDSFIRRDERGNVPPGPMKVCRSRRLPPCRTPPRTRDGPGGSRIGA